MKRYFCAETMDDALRDMYSVVMEEGREIAPTKGAAREIFGVLFELQNPRARVSRSQSRERIFSALGELLWYLSGSDDAAHISYYVPFYQNPELSIDGHVIGAYGPRLSSFDGVDQMKRVIDILRRSPDTRNAVLQLFDHEDTRHAPCTLTLQFVNRDGALIALASMRSNDLFLGLPHDVFAFTMIQEIVARSTGTDVGAYFHSVGSLHLYLANIEATSAYLREGWQDGVAMPAMPVGDPWDNIRALLQLEEQIRCSDKLDLAALEMPESPYWRDLTLLLSAFKLMKERRIEEMSHLRSEFESSYFRSILQERADREQSRQAEQC